MNDNTHNIDRLLKARFIDEPAVNLADRIIHQASLNTPNSVVTAPYWARFKELFIVNYPAFASVACLVIGLYVGILTENEVSGSLDNINEWLSFTSLDEEGYL